MSWTRSKIQDALCCGDITITPYAPDQLSVASYDVTLHPELVIYDAIELDAAAENPVTRFPIPTGGYLLRPGVLYLASTVEFVDLARAEAIVDGKSSLGRLGLSIHQTAGYLDPGFRGQITLELSVTQPVRVYAGMLIGQVRFFTPEGPITAYHGRYQGQAGPTPSRSWTNTKRT